MKKAIKSPHPKWALKYRSPGTELRCLNDRYYLYSVSSKYDPILKRAKKITGKILGSITQKDGFIKSNKGLLREKAEKSIIIENICSKEYGFTFFIEQCLSDITDSLKKCGTLANDFNNGLCAISASVLYKKHAITFSSKLFK